MKAHANKVPIKINKGPSSQFLEQKILLRSIKNKATLDKKVIKKMKYLLMPQKI